MVPHLTSSTQGGGSSDEAHIRPRNPSQAHRISGSSISRANRWLIWRCSTPTIPRTRYVPKPGAEYVPRDKLTEGDTLMSTLCRPMMTFVRETPDPKGVHDTHNRMCNRFLCGGDVRATARGHPGHHGPLHELPPRLRAGALGNRRAGSRSTPCNEAPTTQPFTTSGRRPAPRGRPSPGAGSP